MYDFNFFESLSPRSKQQDASSRSLLGLIVLLGILLAAWPLFNLGHSYKLNKDIETLKAQVTQDKKYPLLEQANALREYINQRNEQLSVLKKTDSELTDGEWLNEAFLYTLVSTAPKDLRFNQLSVLPEKTVKIAGIAKNKPAIAELERSLRDSDRFQVLHVESISNNEGTYDFIMNLELKGVSEDAAN